MNVCNIIRTAHQEATNSVAEIHAGLDKDLEINQSNKRYSLYLIKCDHSLHWLVEAKDIVGKGMYRLHL